MSREEAIDLLDNLIGMVEDNHESDYDTALQMGIKALKQEPCEDAISREAVIKTVDAHTNEDGTLDDDISVILEELPSFKPQEKTGHWIEEDMFDGDVAYRCSECSELFWIESGTPKDNGYDFCPKCGKRLVEPQEGE